MVGAFSFSWTAGKVLADDPVVYPATFWVVSLPESRRAKLSKLTTSVLQFAHYGGAELAHSLHYFSDCSHRIKADGSSKIQKLCEIDPTLAPFDRGNE